MSSASLAGSPVQYDPYDQFNAYQQQGMAQNMYGHHHGYASPPPGQAVYVQQQFPMAPAIQQQHRPGLLPQGTAIVIGEHTVVVDKFLSEGGFAHVYLVQTTEPVYLLGEPTDQLVLKRVAVPDKETLREVRWEVDVMKLVRGHRHIVNLIEATAAPIPGSSGYEVFILMEYCPGGGIIDMMNTRLQHRLTEGEILKIFSDVVEGVCWMHTRDPPLMHRDLKVENILLAGPQFYKLCDFGSTTTPRASVPSSVEEIKALEAELNKHTTLQYRSPEMCDVWSKKAVGLPSDIWALGVLLYKLCFYITPFEDQGPMAILNVQYQMPAYPAYSHHLCNLIASMLVERADKRPSAYHVHKEVCRLRGVQVNLEYKSRAVQPVQLAPSPAFNGAATPNLPSRSTSITDLSNTQNFSTNDIQPMRRGRPAKSSSVSSGSSVAQLKQGLEAGHSSNSDKSRHNLVRKPSRLQQEWNNGDSHTTESRETLGFADSFEPAVQSSDMAAGMSTLATSNEADPQAVLPPAQSKTALATAALFEELTSPGSTIKQPQTLAALQAQRNQQQTASRQSAAATNAGYQGMRPGSTSFGASSQRRVSPTTRPVGPRTLQQPINNANSNNGRTTISMPFSVPDQAASGSDSMQRQDGVTQHAQPENIDEVATPRSSLAPFKPPKPASFSQSGVRPDLTSQASQTDSQQTLDSPDGPLEPASTALEPSHVDFSASQKVNMQRFPSINDWDAGFAGSPPVENTTAQSAPSADLLGDIAADDSIPVVPEAGSVPAAEQEPPSALGGLTRHPSIRVLSPLPSPRMEQSGSSVLAESPKDKFKPIKRESPVVHRQKSLSITSVSSGRSWSSGSAFIDVNQTGSDQPQMSNNTLPRRQGSSLSSAGKHSLGASPALSENPVEQDVHSDSAYTTGNSLGLGSLVSRYESLSTVPSEKPKPPAKPPKPPTAAKPAALRQAPSVSNGKLTSSLPDSTSSSSMEEFNNRFPALEGEEGRSPKAVAVALQMTTENASTPRQSFKPSRDNSSGSISSIADGSALNGASRARPLSSVQHGMPLPQQDKEQDKETPSKNEDASSSLEYQGVASLRDRWQKTMGGAGR